MNIFADVPFTAEQSAAGKQVYADHCQRCHGETLEGISAPDLVGVEFAENWGRRDRNLETLFYITRTTMPRDAGNSLDEEEYVQVVAFMLEQNGYQPGSISLTADKELMSAISLEEMAARAEKHSPAPPYIEGDRGLEPVASGPSHEELLQAAGNTRDWLYHTRDYSGSRYVPLDQINRGNAAELQVKCAYQLGTLETFQAGPIVHDGMMYITTAQVTVAIDATNCKEKWRHDWRPRDRELWKNNRGVAIKDGRIVRGTADGYLFALDAADGNLLWARHVADPALGETITMAPMIYKDLVLIGPAGSENNISGWVGAFRLDNGEQVWKFKTVPGAKDPTADDSWPNPNNIQLGGGAVWTPFSLDVGREELYVAVTNPAPDLPAHLRPGDNLYTNSIVALDVNSGELRWYSQMVPNDFHDWDLTQVSPIYRAQINGETRDLVATVGKDGVLRPVDQVSHERLFETAVTTMKNVEEPLTTEGVDVCPGVLGGVEWNGPAYNPLTKNLYVNSVDWCTNFALDEEEVRYVQGQLYLGGKMKLADDSQGWLTAVDAVSGEVRWRHRADRPQIAAVTTTAGELVFTGELDGDFLALDANDGTVLYRFQTGGAIGGGIVSYAIDGRQFVATTSGQPSMWFAPSGSATLLIFALPESSHQENK